MDELSYLSRSAILNGYAEVTTGLGLDPYGLVRELGLPPACLSEPELRIPTAAALKLFEVTAARAGILDLGLRISQTRQFSTLGAVGLFMREQPTLRKAIDVMADNIWAHLEGVSLAVEETDELYYLMPVIAHQVGGPGRQAIELTVAVVVKILRRFLGPNWRPEMIAFSHPRARDLSLHVRLFGQAPIFEHDRNAVVLKTVDMDTLIPEADPDAANELARYLKFVAGTHQASFTARVEEVISLLLPRGECGIEQVATYFEINRRTVHRRLAAQGTSFEKLVQATRVDLARAYLAAGDLSRTEISQLLGFSCLSAFSRWSRNYDLTQVWPGEG